MMIHLESNNCSTTREELDRLAQECYQSRTYVVRGYEAYLSDGERQNNRPETLFDAYDGDWHCCSECSKTSSTIHGIKMHVNSPVHDPFAYECPGCDSHFTSISGLLQHVESKSCDESIDGGSGTIGNMLHYVNMRI